MPFEWKQFYVAVSLNANELPPPPPPPPFQNRATPLQLLPAKKHLFCSDYHVYRSEIMHFKPYLFKLLIYGFLSALIWSTRTENGCHSMRVLN